MKKKMDDLLKIKLIYSGELGVFSLLFLVLGILEILHILGLAEFVLYIFHFATPVGVLIMIGDLIWAIKSERRRKNAPLFDKFTSLPIAIYFLVIDIIMYINYMKLEQTTYQTFIGVALVMFSIIYGAQAFYHWFNPIPSLLEELEKEKLEKITYKVVEKKEDGSIIAINLYDEKKYLFPSEYQIIEEVDNTFSLEKYPSINKEDIKEA